MRIELGGTPWALYRSPLRPTGDTAPPGLEDAQRVATVDVPGNLQLQLGYEDPWLDDQELIRLNHDEWSYVRAFDTPAGAGDGRALLVFAGVDYFCDVFLNGRHVGHHEGCFTTFELDVSDALAPEGAANELVVAVSCPWRVDDRAFYLEPSTVFSVVLKHSEYMKGNLLHYWDGLPLSGYAIFPFGLWNDVALELRSGPTVTRVAVATRTIGDPAEVEITTEWWSDADGPVEVDVRYRIEGETFTGPALEVEARVAVEPGATETVVRAQVAEPRLWWTWDTGPQELYRCTALVDGAERATTVFGIREVVRDDATMTYTVNGQRLFLRGVWYPFANIFSAAPGPREHWRDVEMLRECNVNHIVSFTFIEKEALYDACDRLGILIMQELPYQQLGPMRAVDPEHPRFEEYWRWSLDAVENIVRQRRGHASVVVWGAFAETRKQGRWVWGDYTDYDAAIRERVERLDRDAVYHPSFCDFNEEHIWNGGFPFGEYWDHAERNHAFISEFGGIAPPVRETLEEILPREALWGRDERADGRLQLPIDVEEYSYRWAFDYAGLSTSVARMYRWADRQPPTLDRFVDAIQWYQALGLRYCAETYRRKRFADIAGCRTWSYRENVPGIKFTVVDHRQRPKQGYFGLQAGYEPLLLSVEDRYPLRPRVAGSAYRHDVWVINDRPAGESLELTATLAAADGRAVGEQRFAVEVSGDAGVVAGSLDLALPAASGPVLLRLEARDGADELRASSERWIRVVEPAFAQPLRVLLLGQARYNAPIVEALEDVGGVELEVVDETVRHPQDSAWSEGLANRVDVVWFAGWDTAAHFFRQLEWANIAEAVRAGVGLLHTGGQASFHGGDGRGALLDVTPLGDVLPVTLQPHDAVWDATPAVQLAPGGRRLGGDLERLPFKGFSRTRARSGARVDWLIGEHPLLVSGRHGEGRTVAFTGYLTKPLRMFRIGEGLDWEDPLDVEPHWARADIKAYGPHWPGNLELALDLLAEASGRPLTAPAAALADAVRRPLFEELAELPETTLSLRVEACAWDEERGETRGRLRVTNAGGVAARLVRGLVDTGETRDHRFRDGFVDLLPGASAELRFEASCPPSAIRALVVRAQNAVDAEVAP